METDIDNLDRQIVNALQIEPRASWAKVAAVLGVDAATVSRRWNRLREAGLAWVTAYQPGPGEWRTAAVEVECTGNPLEAAAAVSSDRECFALDVTSGARDLLLWVRCDSEVALGDYILTRLGARPQIRSVRAHLVTSFLSEASDWRLGALSPARAERFTGRAHHTPATAPTLSGLDRAVLAALHEDGRMPSTEIAARTGIPVRRARDTVQRLLADRRTVLRTDVAVPVSGRPVQAWYFMRVPAGRVATAAAQLTRLAQTRLMITTVGTYNLVMGVWLRELSDVTRLEARIEARLDGVRIPDRCVTLRTVKRAGHLLDPHSRHLTFLP
ncbi:Lrp/AsnC family transcriptional regulator [Streptomyces sp. NPDC007205]|uniref:Lrp/AsnC family transcriptional regulator n=1 Tax=Streptomyces sp. NPDC007205 TaxID=3154316 RepID=UPI0033E097FF